MRLDTLVYPAVVFGVLLGISIAIHQLWLPQHGKMTAAQARAQHKAAQQAGRDLGLPGFIDRSHLLPQ